MYFFAWAVVEVEYSTFSQLFYQVFHSPLPTRFWWWDWFLKAVPCGLYKMAGVTGKINHPVMCVESVYGSVSHWVAGKVIFMQFVEFVNNLGSIWYTASHSHSWWLQSRIRYTTTQQWVNEWHSCHHSLKTRLIATIMKQSAWLARSTSWRFSGEVETNDDRRASSSTASTNPVSSPVAALLRRMIAW